MPTIRHWNRSYLKPKRLGSRWKRDKCPCCKALDDYNRERQRRNTIWRNVGREAKCPQLA